MKVIRNRFLPIGKRYGAINLFGVLFVKRDMAVTNRVLNHEKIHTMQIASSDISVSICSM